MGGQAWEGVGFRAGILRPLGLLPGGIWRRGISGEVGGEWGVGCYAFRMGGRGNTRKDLEFCLFFFGFCFFKQWRVSPLLRRVFGVFFLGVGKHDYRGFVGATGQRGRAG